MERIIPDLATRTQTADILVERDGWGHAKAEAWVHHTAATAEEIKRWDALNVTPAQARTVYAISHDMHVDAQDYLDLGLDGVTTVAYAEAGLTPDEAHELEQTGQRPSEATFEVMKGLRHDTNKAAVADLQTDLRTDSDYADVDDDRTW